jgi:hypothetical protein
MDSYSTLAPGRPDNLELASTPADALPSDALPPVLLTFKETDSSLKEMAKRDLQASLQLLADRMHYVTGASAATIAVKNRNELLCLASAGPLATQPGAPLRTDLTVVNQSINNQQIICCNNTRNGTRSDGTSYQELGVKALMIMPLFRESEAVGIVELLSDRTDAFHDHDGEILEYLSAMVMTALEHADAANRAFSEIAPAQEIDFPSEIISPPAPEEENSTPKSQLPDETPRIHHCEACGFPVSGGRKLCLDCEEARTQPEANTPGFLSELGRERRQGWLQSHFYTIGTFLMVLLTVVMLLLKLR